MAIGLGADLIAPVDQAVEKALGQLGVRHVILIAFLKLLTGHVMEAEYLIVELKTFVPDVEVS
jgi:hypothetical protein